MKKKVGLPRHEEENGTLHNMWQIRFINFNKYLDTYWIQGVTGGFS